MVKVSVLMPVYNTKEEYLKESIESILNQTFQDFELVILDDGSENDVENIVKSFKDNRIKFYKNEQNLGVSKTRNRLLDLAQGKYCAWQDADDISYPERLEKQVKFLDENPEISFLGTNLERFPSKKIISQPQYPKLIDFLGGCVFTQGTSMIRVNDLKDNNLYYDEQLTTSEDYDLFSRAVQVLHFANLQESLLKYRRVSTSLCHLKNDIAFCTDKNIKKRILNTLTKDEKLQKEILKTVLKRYEKKSGFFENIFSIKNKWDADSKIKVLTLLGIQINLKRKA